MNKNKIFLIATVVLVLIGFAGFAFYQQNQVTPNRVSESGIDPSLLVRDHSPIKGAKGAEVTIVEFLDPECEACRAMYPVAEDLLKEYEGKVRLVIRYMPFHGNSVFAASALEEARELGKFEEALYLLFAKQPEWGSHANPRPELIGEYLQSLGISKDKLQESYLVPKHKWKIEMDFQDGKELGVKMTPTFFVNGKMLHEIGYQPLKQAIEEALKSN